MVVGLEGDRGRCIKRFARIAKKSARFLLNRVVTGRFIAKTVFPSIKTAAVKNWHSVHFLDANDISGNF